MAICSRGLVAPPFDLSASRAGAGPWPRPARAIRCCCYARPEPTPRRLLLSKASAAAAASPERAEEWRVDGSKPAASRGRRRVGLTAMPSLPFPSSRYVRARSQLRI